MEKIARKLVADKLRGIRAERNFSLEFVAKKSGVNKDTISRYENGIVSQQVDNLEKILNAYGVDFSIFFNNLYANSQNEEK
ncbi:MAG: helix-turn-helix transcriptional regulator [Firmicutes bacterium]|nr:helix-turn-helix transcriptional regulator [Candidatus Alectryobacillus merdavium]